MRLSASPRACPGASASTVLRARQDDSSGRGMNGVRGRSQNAASAQHVARERASCTTSATTQGLPTRTRNSPARRGRRALSRFRRARTSTLRSASRCGICESGYAIERRGEQPCRSEFHPSATKSEHGNACSWEGRFTDCRSRRARRFECCPRPIAVRVIQNERRNGEGLRTVKASNPVARSWSSTRNGPRSRQSSRGA